MLSSIDHIVLTAKDINKTITFYCNVLGMILEEFTPSDGGKSRKCLKFGAQKINLHHLAAPFKPHAQNPQPGAVDICFLSSLRLPIITIFFFIFLKLTELKYFIKISEKVEFGSPRIIKIILVFINIYILF